jgi:membrane-bound lytic murein transglycosylase B
MLRLTAPILALALAIQQPAPPQLPVVQLPPAQSFEEWVAAFKAEALTRGIKSDTLERAFEGVQPLPIVVERDTTQPELVLPLDEFLKRRLARPLLRMARKMRTQHATILKRVSTKYGVPPGIIVAIWGIESNFGRFSGVRPTVATLATLAYNPRRSAMFREELIDALKILDSGDVEPAALRGSWAGALGQPQFMPSSFLEYAQDFDGDGRRDIWRSMPDVFASIAYYLQAHGWKKAQTWGREVKVPAKLEEKVAEVAPLQTEGCLAQRQMTRPLPVSEWRKLGVRTRSGSALPPAALDASLVSAGTRKFLVYPNYQALLAYNCVHAYGLTVALLADTLR